MKEGIRFYLMGIIVILLALSVPEVKQITMRATYSPQALHILQKIQDSSAYYVDQSNRILSLLLQQLKPELSIKSNGVTVPLDTSNAFSLKHGQSISVEQCETILLEYNSPAVNTCQKAMEYAHTQHIDFAYVLAMFIHESSAGTNKAWAGIKSNGTITHNTGNIICAGYKTCYGRFRDYPDWNTGWKEHIDLLAHYRDVNKDKTLEQALYRWAPPIENDTNAYYIQAKKNITAWREINARTVIQITNNNIQPITKDMRVLSDYYARAPVWCFQDSTCPKDQYGNPLGKGQHFGVDIAIAPNEKAYAPIDGIFIACGEYTDSARIGEYIIYDAAGYELYIGHLANTMMFCQKKVGDLVKAGEVIGYGNKNVVGPHVHVQLQKDGKLLDYLQYYKERITK